MFGSIGVSELVVILVIGLVIFGPRRLPELGRTINEFKRASRGLQETLGDEVTAEESRASRAAVEPTTPRQSDFSDHLSTTAGGGLN